MTAHDQPFEPAFETGGSAGGSNSTAAHVETIKRELKALTQTMPDALTRQWEASPVPKPREDTPQRTKGDRPANPTADIVLDARRLAVRESVVKAERVLRDAAVALGAARLGMERAVARFDGEDA